MNAKMALKESGLRGSLRNVSTGVGGTDSAILQNDIDEGSGTTAADSIGSNDLSINGPGWSSDSSLVGNYGLSFDQTDDSATYSTTDSRFSRTETWSYAITLKKSSATSSAQTIVAHVFGTNSDDLWGIDIDNNGTIRSGVYDGSSYFTAASGSEPSAPYTARILVRYDGSDIDLFVNTNEKTGTDAPALPTDEVFKIGERSNDRYLGGVIDNTIGYSANLTDSGVQQDYDAQPWS